MSKAQWMQENLKPGEIYAGLILGKDGQPDHHLFLLEAKPANKLNWEAAKAWASSVGGELPTRSEQSLLFANAKEQFEPYYYWSGEQDAGDPDYAWVQGFGNGLQDDNRKSYEYRARAVRRLIIE
ncbi:hypothetical protein UNDKW_1630 [Undibacterium sp. KW1]|uniref:DUF1566 domain-containing protein n=1 Tax=Undibacterium sp. KW1 TaxID=2058624 RepID=UPI001331F0B0|nr:DUF1566 domain-containing protein [Undibacterium sp. KW1]BBB59903.1 hypothetical protein UNDKW_1630 [Undibacterium sp. KW1]